MAKSNGISNGSEAEGNGENGLTARMTAPMSDERLAEIKELAEEDKRWIGVAGYDSTYIPELIAEVERLRTEECWTCFHCGEFFDDPDRAAEHFGDRADARPAACLRMLIAIAESFERYGIHRPFHNAASVKQLAQQRDEARAEVERLRQDRAAGPWVKIEPGCVMPEEGQTLNLREDYPNGDGHFSIGWYRMNRWWNDQGNPEPTHYAIINKPEENR